MAFGVDTAKRIGRAALEGSKVAANFVGDAYSRLNDEYSQVGADVTPAPMTADTYSPELAAMNMGRAIFAHARSKANDAYLRDQISMEKRKSELGMSRMQQQIDEAKPSYSVSGVPATRGEAERRGAAKVMWPGGHGLPAGPYDPSVLAAWASMTSASTRADSAKGSKSDRLALTSAMKMYEAQGKARLNELIPLGATHANRLVHFMGKSQNPATRLSAYTKLGLLGGKNTQGKYIETPDQWEAQWSTLGAKGPTARQAAIEKATSGWRSSFNSRKASEIESRMSQVRNVIGQKLSKEIKGGMPFSPDIFATDWESSVGSDYADTEDMSQYDSSGPAADEQPANPALQKFLDQMVESMKKGSDR